VKKRAHGGTAKSKRPEGGGRTKDSGSEGPAAPPRFVFIHRRVGQARVGHEARGRHASDPAGAARPADACSRKQAWVLVPGANPDRGRADTKLLRIHPARGRRSRPLSAMAMLGAASVKPRPSAAPSTCGGVQIWIRRRSATGAVGAPGADRFYACGAHRWAGAGTHRSDPRQSTRRGEHSRGRATWARAGPRKRGDGGRQRRDKAGTATRPLPEEETAIVAQCLMHDGPGRCYERGYVRKTFAWNWHHHHRTAISFRVR
jgi:hypothetical protein